MCYRQDFLTSCPFCLLFSIYFACWWFSCWLSLLIHSWSNYLCEYCIIYVCKKIFFCSLSDTLWTNTLCPHFFKMCLHFVFHPVSHIYCLLRSSLLTDVHSVWLFSGGTSQLWTLIWLLFTFTTIKHSSDVSLSV